MTENTIGSIEVKQKSLTTLKTNKDLSVSSDVIKILHCSKDIQAVTKLDDKIYVLCSTVFKAGIELHIFEDRDPFQSHKNVRIEEIKWLIRVASSDKFRCLYIWDYRWRCVWRLMADDLKVTKWLSDINEPKSLSTSNDGYLMLLRHDKGVKKLETYGPDAKISRSISLSRDIENPRHFVQEDNGDFIVIHESDKTKNRFWVISKLSNQGQMLRQFKHQEKHHDLTNPFYLYLDSESDRLFVAQKHEYNLKYSLVIFDLESLEWKQTLLLSEDRFNPFSMHYASREKQLLAGRGDEVFVIQIH